MSASIVSFPEPEPSFLLKTLEISLNSIKSEPAGHFDSRPCIRLPLPPLSSDPFRRLSALCKDASNLPHFTTFHCSSSIVLDSLLFFKADDAITGEKELSDFLNAIIQTCRVYLHFTYQSWERGEPIDPLTALSAKILVKPLYHYPEFLLTEARSKNILSTCERITTSSNSRLKFLIYVVERGDLVDKFLKSLKIEASWTKCPQKLLHDREIGIISSTLTLRKENQIAKIKILESILTGMWPF